MSFGFAESIRRGNEAVLLKVNKEVYRIVWELFTSVVQLTPSPSNPGPWAKGLLANQWYPSVGEGVGNLGTDTNDIGADSLNRVNAFVRDGKEFVGKDGKVSLTNNVPYAYQAEAIGWMPPQWTGRSKAARMVARSLMNVAAKNRQIQIRLP